MSGVLTIELVDEQGRTVDTRRVNNLITQRGKQLLAGLLMGKEFTPTRWTIALGTGTADVKLTDTNLQALAAEAEDAAPKVELATREGKAVVLATVTAMLPALTQGSSQALTEAGIRITTRDNTTSLFNRTLFAQVNRGPNMSMKLTWEITF